MCKHIHIYMHLYIYVWNSVSPVQKIKVYICIQIYKKNEIVYECWMNELVIWIFYV